MLNNPLIPGDPFSYDLKWIVAKLKAHGNRITVLEGDVLDLKSEIAEYANLYDYITEAIKKGGLAYVTPELYGAYGDGVHDDTQSIQTAIDTELPVVFKPGANYLVSLPEDSITALQLKDGSVLLGNDCTLTLAGNDLDRYRIIGARMVNNIIISDLKIVGDLQQHGGATGEWGYGISIAGCTNVIIKNCHCSYCWGDGINISATYDLPVNSIMTYNVHVDGCSAKHNRRNGISVEGGEYVFINDTVITDNAGTSPQAGIDVEPSFYDNEGTLLKYEYVDRLYITNCTIKDNGGPSIMIMDSAASKDGSIVINSAIMRNLVFNARNDASKTYVRASNLTFDAENIAALFDLFVTNSGSNIEVDSVTIRNAASSNLIMLESALAGTARFNNISVDGSLNRVISHSAFGPDSANGLLINNLDVSNANYIDNVSENRSNGAAVVHMAKNIIEKNKTGWFNVDSIANMYIYDADAAANTYIQLPWMYDEYEITVINASSRDIRLEKENANRPNILFNDMTTHHNLSLTNGSVTLKFNNAMGAWIVQHYTGTLTA